MYKPRKRRRRRRVDLEEDKDGGEKGEEVEKVGEGWVRKRISMGRRKKSVDSERLAKRMKFIMYMGGQ